MRRSAEGWPQRGARRRRLRAAIALAISFSAWRSLVREQAVSCEEAIELMDGLVSAAAGGRR